MALLAKLLWRLIHQPQNISSRILEDKYGGWLAIADEKKCQNCSYVWRGMKFAARGLVWKIQNGAVTLFWLDAWLGNELLICQAI